MDTWGGERLIADVNQGGDMFESVIRQIDPLVAIKKVHASRSKIPHAEPVAALYEQGRIKHELFVAPAVQHR
jgi:phage terminase large subunit-like protein